MKQKSRSRECNVENCPTSVSISSSFFSVALKQPLRLRFCVEQASGNTVWKDGINSSKPKNFGAVGHRFFFGNSYFDTLVNPEWNCSIVDFFPWICILVHHQWKVSFDAKMNLLSCCIVFLVHILCMYYVGCFLSFNQGSQEIMCN